MRITSSRMLDQAAAATVANQSKLADKVSQVSSGLRVQTPSDDPSAWLAAHRAQLKKQLSEGTGVAMQFSRDRLDESDRALASVLDAVTATRALAVQGGNDSYNAANRRDLALQVRSLFESAVGAANTRAPDGEYLLAGAASLSVPFDANGVYLGDAGTRQIPTTEASTSLISVAGSRLTATNGVDVLPLLKQVADALDANDPTLVRSLLTDLQTAIDQVSNARSLGGGAMAVLDEAAKAHSQLEQNLDQDISRYVEVDIVNAASELAKATQALDASRAVTSRVIDLLGRTSSA